MESTKDIDDRCYDLKEKLYEIINTSLNPLNIFSDIYIGVSPYENVIEVDIEFDLYIFSEYANDIILEFDISIDDINIIESVLSKIKTETIVTIKERCAEFIKKCNEILKI